MNSTQLANLLDDAIYILEKNNELVNLDLLDKASDILYIIQPLVEDIFGEDGEKVIGICRHFISVQRQLDSGELLEALKKIRNRPMLLRVISAIL